MELIYVIPADSAQANADGKFSLLGGGIESISAPAFPAVQSGLALVVRLRAYTSEAEQDHTFRVDIIGPKDFHVTSGVVAEFRPIPLPNAPESPITINLILNMQLLVFPEPGTYLFHLYVDSQEMGTFPLDVQRLTIDDVNNL